MTTSLLIIISLFMALVGLGLALWRLSTKSSESAVDLRILTEDRPACRTYDPLSRLFAFEDSEFLRRQRGYSRALERRLGRQRRRVLSLYLRQIRKEFGQVWDICRLLAPMSTNPDFGALVTKQFLIFHGLYWTLQAQCLTGALLPLQVNAAGLADALRRLEQGARGMVRSLDAAQAAAFGA